jgi:predicted amidohydrolase YtcJ
VVERAAYVVPTLAIIEQMSRFGSPEQETMALLVEIPAPRRQYWRATAATSLDQTAAAATRTAAAFRGQARTLGTLEADKIADLVVLDADPVASITAIRRIEVVICDGRVV